MKQAWSENETLIQRGCLMHILYNNQKHPEASPCNEADVSAVYIGCKMMEHCFITIFTTEYKSEYEKGMHVILSASLHRMK